MLGDDHPAVLATIESIEHVDTAMGNGGRTRSVSFFQDYLFHSYIRSVVPHIYASACVGLQMFGFPTSVEDAAQKAANCSAGTQPAMRQSMMSFKGIMTLGLTRSQRFYQRVEDILVAETSEVCGPIGPEDVISNDGSYGSVSTARRRRAEV